MPQTALGFSKDRPTDLGQPRKKTHRTRLGGIHGHVFWNSSKYLIGGLCQAFVVFVGSHPQQRTRISKSVWFTLLCSLTLCGLQANYSERFTPVVPIEGVWLQLACACFWYLRRYTAHVHNSRFSKCAEFYKHSSKKRQTNPRSNF